MEENFKVFTLGDALITLNPTETGPLRYIPAFTRKIGEAELNFAIGCAEMNLGVSFIILHEVKELICRI